MGAVFGAASRATFTFIVFAFEIVRDYNAVLPLMLVSVIAYAIAVRYLPNSIMTEKLARRGLNTNQDYETNALKQLKVEEVMVRDVATVVPEESVRVAADRFANGDLKTSRHHALPIVDSAGHLARARHAGRFVARAASRPGRQNERARRRHALAGGRVSRRARLRRRDENARE